MPLTVLTDVLTIRVYGCQPKRGHLGPLVSSVLSLIMPRTILCSKGLLCQGNFVINCCCSVAKLCPTLCDPMDCSTPGFPVLHCLLEFAQIQVHCQWYHPTISFSVVPFSFCLPSFPASGSFPMSRLFASGGQSIGASASVLPINIQGWFPLRLTGLISLQSKGLSRVFSNNCLIIVRTQMAFMVC